MLSHFKLGGKPFQPSDKDLHFKAYLSPNLDQLLEASQAPGALNWFKIPTITGDMPTPNRDALHNDAHGNCVYAGMANGTMQVAQRVGRALIITGDEVDAAYADTGFDPVTGAGDNGTDPTQALTDWTRKDIFGTRCDAFCVVDHTSRDEVLLALFLGGWLLGTYGLPISAQNQVDANGNPDWRVDPQRESENGVGSWGYHAMAEHAARLAQGTTWGLNAHWDDPWRSRYCSVLHLALLRDWQMPNGRAPNGFEYQALLSDARARGARQ